MLKSMASPTRWIPILAAAGVVLLGSLLAWHNQQRFPALAPQSAGEEHKPGRTVIYPDAGQAEADIATALTQAAKENKRVLLDFGGNWCGDCQVLELYLHDAANRSLLDSHFVLVPVNIGRFDQNLAIAARYRVPIRKGVPALAVLSPAGDLVYSQQNGEFEALRTMDSAAVTAFLLQWKG